MYENPTYTSFMAVMIVLIIFGIYAILKMSAATKKLEAENEAKKANLERSAQSG